MVILNNISCRLKQSFILSLTLKVIFFSFFLFATNGLFLSRLIEILNTKKYVYLVVFFGVWTVSLITMILVMWSKSTYIRLFWGLFLSISAFAAATFQNINGLSLDYGSFEFLWIAKDHANHALSFYWSKGIWPFAGSILGFLGFILPPPKASKTFMWSKFNNLILLGPTIPILIIVALIFRAQGYGTIGLPTPYTSISMGITFSILNNLGDGYYEQESDLLIKSGQKPMVKHIVFIIDESVRSDFLGINSNTLKTPYIESIKEKINNFGTASSANNCSSYSNFILRTGASFKNLPKIGSLPNIWRYAKAAGFTTAFLDGQTKGGILQNFMDDDEKSYIDNFYQFAQLERSSIDLSIAKKIKELTKNESPHFILVNKMAAHFPFESSYPETAKVFSPVMAQTELNHQNRDKFINSYKNSLLWNVDHFFEILLEKENLKNTFVIYTSDHGQNLMDSPDKVMTHCNVASPHPNEGRVPLFTITDNKDIFKLFEDASKKNFNKTTHFNIFPSLLVLMGYQSDLVKEHYSNLLWDNIQTPQEFTSGSLIPRFFGTKVQWNSIKK